MMHKKRWIVIPSRSQYAPAGSGDPAESGGFDNPPRTFRDLLILLVAAAVMALAGCSSPPKPAPRPALTAQPSPATGPRPSGNTVVASGEIVPAQDARLGFTMPGRVQRVAVEIGDEVQAGEVLVALESSSLEAEVAQAEAALQLARAQLARLKAGPQPAKIVAAEGSIEAAEAAVQGASAQLAQLQTGGHAADIAAAEADLAQAALQEKELQENHDKLVRFILKHGVGGGPMEEQLRAALEAARLATEAARKRLEQTKAGATRSELEAARANIAAAEAQQAIAQAQLNLLQAGATAEEIATAEAMIAQAEASLQAARIGLDQTTLQAPFAGKITALEVSPGEAVVPGQAVLTLAKLDQLRAETTDLSERDVVGVAVGQRATVFVEALGLDAEGQVVNIEPQANKAGGDVVYTVAIELDEQPPGLRWGMSVEVEIVTE